jgi:hypothetical protein
MGWKTKRISKRNPIEEDEDHLRYRKKEGRGGSGGNRLGAKSGGVLDHRLHCHHLSHLPHHHWREGECYCEGLIMIQGIVSNYWWF